MTDRLLTPDEQHALDVFVEDMRREEMERVVALFKGTRSRRRIAAGYQEFISCWREARATMQATLTSGVLPPNTSEVLFRAMINQAENIIDDKLHLTEVMFEMEFGAAIFQYLKTDQR